MWTGFSIADILEGLAGLALMLVIAAVGGLIGIGLHTIGVGTNLAIIIVFAMFGGCLWAASRRDRA